MKLRTQILLLLFLLGLTPLLVSVTTNVPLVFEQLERFYHEAYLQKLRTDFSDLDQHITQRQEVARLFAKFPEPGLNIKPTTEEAQDKIHEGRAAYTEWANRVLFDQPDVSEVIFINRDGDLSFSLDRDIKTGILMPNSQLPSMPPTDFVTEGLKLRPGTVLTSPIVVDRTSGISAPDRFMTLRFITPVFSTEPSSGGPEFDGAVVLNLDVGGLARVYNGIYWVQDDGNYLSPDEDDDSTPSSTAFRDFPGLKAIFARGKLALWQHGNQQIFWVPLFMTEAAGPLWVGRSVDPSPIEDFMRKLEIRAAVIAIVLLLVVFFIARIIAVRITRISTELGNGIGRVLEHDEIVRFNWRRPQELRSLGNNLTRLSEKHAQDTRAMRSHAQELEESNRYKSEFLANVSHELRTPLNSILLLSKMLVASTPPLPDEQHRQARVIQEAGKDLRTLIDSILDLARIESRKTTLDTEDIDLATVLRDLFELMQPQFSEKGLDFRLVMEPGAPSSLVSDSEKLRRIIINFLSNALKFTDRGKVVLHLGSNRDSDRDTHPLSISVQDSGIGIPADKQGQVFEAFNQVDGSSSRRYGGTGLGLAISNQLAGVIGGRIRLESREGKGSTFSLLLPATLQQNHGTNTISTPRAGNRVPDDEAESGSIPLADYTGKRILLVDDDLRNLLALTPLLESWNLEVIAAGDGKEALETLQTDHRFDLILMDLMMPEMDGFETIGRIRANPELANLYIVALTARAAEDDRKRSLASGADDFLAKPVEPVKLKALIDQRLAATIPAH